MPANRHLAARCLYFIEMKLFSCISHEFRWNSIVLAPKVTISMKLLKTSQNDCHAIITFLRNVLLETITKSQISQYRGNHEDFRIKEWEMPWNRRFHDESKIHAFSFYQHFEEMFPNGIKIPLIERKENFSFFYIFSFFWKKIQWIEDSLLYKNKTTSCSIRMSIAHSY